LDDVARDASYALRVLRKNPGFTAAVVLTFALGIGCSCAIFSLVHGILVRPLPYARPNELVALWERNVSRGADRNVVSEQNFAACAPVALIRCDAAMTPIPLTLDGTPVERVAGAQVSPSYFRLLGAHPALGRDFTDADEANGGTDVVILATRCGAAASQLIQRSSSSDLDGRAIVYRHRCHAAVVRAAELRLDD
jgi:hypothetical protein